MQVDIHGYWDAVLSQDAAGMREFFLPDAVVNWPNTNESFTAEEFIRVNCEYPGSWSGEFERIIDAGDVVITALRVFPRGGGGPSFHAVSFISLSGGKIFSVDEYWGDDGSPPQWRLDLGLGRPVICP